MAKRLIKKSRSGSDQGGAYSRFWLTLPPNQQAPESEYHMYLYWLLNGKPKSFWEAVRRGMFKFNPYDVSFHANTLSEGDDGVLYFMKPKGHPTVKYELDWYNNAVGTRDDGSLYPLTGEELMLLLDFKSRYRLDGSGEDYKYVPL